MFRAEPTGVRNPPSVASRTIDSAAAVIVGAAFSTLLLLACRAYAQMPEGFDRLLLVDANGRRIGIVTEFGEGADDGDRHDSFPDPQTPTDDDPVR